MLSGTPDIILGLQSAYDVAEMSSSDWRHSLAKPVQDAVKLCKTTAYGGGAGDLVNFVTALEQSKNSGVSSLIQWVKSAPPR